MAVEIIQYLLCQLRSGVAESRPKVRRYISDTKHYRKAGTEDRLLRDSIIRQCITYSTNHKR